MARQPYQDELRRVVDHFLYYLSNEPDPKTGISPRFRFYGQLPIEASMLFPDVDDDVFLNAVKQQLAAVRAQVSPIPQSGRRSVDRDADDADADPYEKYTTDTGLPRGQK